MFGIEFNKSYKRTVFILIFFIGIIILTYSFLSLESNGGFGNKKVNLKNLIWFKVENTTSGEDNENLSQVDVSKNKSPENNISGVNLSGQSPSKGSGTDNVNSEEEGCSSIENSRIRDWCYRDKAIEQEDDSICQKIENSYYRDTCYREIAIKTGNKTYCNYMQDDERRAWCKKEVSL